MHSTDRQRLAVLAEHGILDTESSPEFDRITALAAAAFAVPTALFTLVDEKRQWFKSRIGFPRSETPREIAFCAATIEGDDLMVIEDATRDPRFLANELVVSDPRVRFYAGAPVRAMTGETLGTVAILDTRPRSMSHDERELLRGLARLAEAELALWRAGVIASTAMRPAIERMRRVSVERERRFAALIRNSRDVITLLDASGQAVDVSPSVEKVLGYSPKQFLAISSWELVHPDDASTVAASLAHVLATPQAATKSTFRFRHVNGSWRDLEVVAENLLDVIGIEALVCHSRDVTERVLAERAMRERALQQTALAELGAKAARISNPREIERAAVACVVGAVPGARCMSVAAGEGRWDILASAPEPIDVELQIDGPLLDLAERREPIVIDAASDDRFAAFRAIGAKHVLLAPVRAEPATPRALVVLLSGERRFTDGDVQLTRSVASLVGAKIGEYTTREQLALRERELDVAQKMEALGRLAGGITHDVGNVLAAIAGLADTTLRQLPEHSPARAGVIEIREAAFRGGGITKQILAFAMKHPTARAPIRVDEVVSNVARFLEQTLGEGTTLEVAIEPDLPEVSADAAQVEQVLLNLCANAREAMPEGGTIRIGCRLRSDAAGRRVELSVGDEGEGMSPDVAARAFDPFFTTKAHLGGGGFGLGLATVRGIVEQHGGAIEVESAPGKGTRMCVLLPVAMPDRAPAALPREELDGDGELVLLADDNAAVRVSASQLLTSAGYRVIEAVDGADAVAKFAEHAAEVRVVVLDASMPRASGAEALDRIRELRPDVPALFCTGGDERDLVKPGERVQALQKPFMPVELLARIRDLITPR